MAKKSAFLTLLALLASLFPSTAIATENDQTVSLVVPASAAPRTLSSDAAEGRWVRVEVPLQGTVERTLEAARADFGPDVSVEHTYELLVTPANDPLYEDQWHLENSADTDIDANTAWGVSDGSGVVIAVIDPGVEASHPDLDGQVIAGFDYIDNDNDPSPGGSNDDESHGTFVAGLIAAADNGVGGLGVAPGARILNIRACVDGSCQGLDIVNAIYEAVDKGVDIVNLSLGSPGYPDDDIPLRAAIDYARSKDVLVVAAVGNEATDLDEFEADTGGATILPAGYPLDNILAVAASNQLDRKAQFSNYGSIVDLYAPGEDMVSTVPGGYASGGRGTSYAAPVAAGVAALLLSHDPGIGYQELTARLTAFTDRPSGLDLYSGRRVNAGKTLTNRFIDTSSSVFNDTIKWLAEQGITEGCNPPQNHEYCPGDNVTRGQMAVFFSRTFGLPATSTDYFEDDDGHFYENAANQMAAAGITVGCGSDRYCGNRDISRGEMAAMLSRALGLPAPTTDHFDDDAGNTFESAINRIADAGITQGCNPPTNDRYCPDNNVNRGQMAAFLQRSWNLAN